MRVIGRRELSSLEPFDLILLVVLGDARAAGRDAGRLLAHRCRCSRSARSRCSSSACRSSNFRFPRLRPLLDGEPIVVVQDGKPIEKQHAARAHDARRSRRRGAPAEHRAHRRRPVGGDRDERRRSASSRSPRLMTLHVTEERGRRAALAGGRRRRRSRRASGGWPRGAVENRPRYRLGARARRARGHGRVRPRARLRGRRRSYAAFADGRALRGAALPRATAPELVAVDRGGQARAAAHRCGERRSPRSTSRAAARRTLGVIGCGWQAESQVACIRAAVPSIERVVAYCRTESRLSDVLRAARLRSRARATATRPSATSSSRSPARPIRCSAASGCSPVRSSARSARTTAAGASSTTSCSSARASSAATRSRTRGSSRPT